MIVTRGLGDNSLLITRGFGFSIYVEHIISIIPEFITRRVSIDKILRRTATVSIARREDD